MIWNTFFKKHKKIKIGITQCSFVIFRSSGISISEKDIEELVSVYNPAMFKLSFWTLINANRSNTDFNESIKQLLKNQGYSRKKSLDSIIKASTLTGKENILMEYPTIDNY